MEYIIIYAGRIYGIFLKGVKNSNLQIVNYIIKPATEYWLDFDVPCITFSLWWKCFKVWNSESTVCHLTSVQAFLCHFDAVLYFFVWLPFYFIATTIYVLTGYYFVFIVFCTCDLFHMIRPGLVHNTFMVGVVMFLHIQGYS